MQGEVVLSALERIVELQVDAERCQARLRKSLMLARRDGGGLGSSTDPSSAPCDEERALALLRWAIIPSRRRIKL